MNLIFNMVFGVAELVVCISLGFGGLDILQSISQLKSQDR